MAYTARGQVYGLSHTRGKSLEEQFKKLVLQPLLAVGQDKAISSTLVVIDALYEFEPKEELKTILTRQGRDSNGYSNPILLNKPARAAYWHQF
jgi:hypothetical protein